MFENRDPLISRTPKAIKYFYDATGVKLKKTVHNFINITTTDYAGNYIYENNDLKFFSHPEGYVEPDGNGGYDYVYQYKDHLGNIRLSYTENTETQEEVVFSDGLESASGWDGSGNSWGHPISAFDSTFKRTGNYSGRLDRDAGDGNAWDTSTHSNDWVAIDIDKPTYYTMSAWMFLEDVNDNRAQLYLFMKTNEETGYNTAINLASTIVKGQWVKIEKSVLVQDNIDKLNIRITNRYDGKVWFDDVKITKGNASNAIIVEENNYYPFGLKHKGYNYVINGTDHKYGFGGKEEQDELGLKWLDFSARNYDPAIGRWMNLDPLAEQMRRHSPYNYAYDNPIYFIDPDGMMPFGGWPNPIRGIGDQIGRAVTSKINSFNKSVKRGWSNFKGLFRSSSESSERQGSGGQGGIMLSNEKGGSTGVTNLIRQANRSESGNIDQVDASGLAQAGNMAKSNKQGIKYGKNLKTVAKVVKNTNSGLKLGMKVGDEFKSNGNSNNASINSANTSDEASNSSGTIEVTVRNSEIGTGGYGSQIFAETVTRDTIIAVPDNPVSIDSLKNVYKKKENDINKQVKEYNDGYQ